MSERAYMAYCRGDGPQEGAVLVFAPNAREARIMAYPHVSDWTGCSFIDVAVQWLRKGCEHLRRMEGPHVVDDPKPCVDCNIWWEEPYDENGRCEGCAETNVMDTPGKPDKTGENDANT